MGYTLHALISKRETLEAQAQAFQKAVVVLLACDMALIPVTNELHEEMGGENAEDHFEKMSPELESWAVQISRSASIAYVEAEYFGGVGEQSAIVWQRGTRVFQLTQAEDSINQALRFLGVGVEKGKFDEFDTIGLGRHRSTEDWVQESQRVD